MHLILCRKEGELIAVYTDEEYISSEENDLEYERVEAYSSTVRRYVSDSFLLYRIVFEGGESFWINAASFGEAITDAVIFMKRKEAYKEVTEAQEFDISEEDHNKRIEIAQKRYIIYPPAKRLLSVINERNKDFCALLLDELEDVKDDDELKARNRARKHSDRPFNSLSAVEVKETFFCWYSPCVYESDLDADLVRSLLKKSDSEDREGVLFYSYAASVIFGFQPSLQWELYRHLIDNSFEPYFDEYLSLVKNLD